MQEVNKLVRDRVPRNILKNRTLGERIKRVKPYIRTLSDDEYKRELYRKVLEELREFRKAKTPEERFEEFCDVAEALDALRCAEGYGDTQVLNGRACKNSKAGMFRNRIFLERVG